MTVLRVTRELVDLACKRIAGVTARFRTGVLFRASSTFGFRTGSHLSLALAERSELLSIEFQRRILG